MDKPAAEAKKEEGAEEAKPDEAEKPKEEEESKDEPMAEAREGEEKKEGGESEEKKEDNDEEAKPRPMHKVTSIFLRNLSPTITKQEVEAMCKRYPGFLRAAIADPQPERRWFRRGWITFERDVKIKEVCFR